MGNSYSQRSLMLIPLLLLIMFVGAIGEAAFCSFGANVKKFCHPSAGPHNRFSGGSNTRPRSSALVGSILNQRRLMSTKTTVIKSSTSRISSDNIMVPTIDQVCQADDDEKYHDTSHDNSSRNLWDDRLALQARWTLPQKGWKVQVEWKMTKCGIGLFANQQHIPAGTLLRKGVWGVNLYPFASLKDVEDFLQDPHLPSYQPRLRYVKDYLWGFYPSHITNEQGYYNPGTTSQDSSSSSLSSPPSTNDDDNKDDDPRLFAMWVPGNGLNHSPVPNTVYVSSPDGIDLMALTDITQGQEMFDDYRRHGQSPPVWLQSFTQQHDVTLNFADCNDFV